MVENINCWIILIAAWFLIGIILIIFLTIEFISDKNKNTKSEILYFIFGIVSLFFFGPIFGLIILSMHIYGRKKLKEKMRTICGWWELKKYGGKY